MLILDLIGRVNSDFSGHNYWFLFSAWPGDKKGFDSSEEAEKANIKKLELIPDKEEAYHDLTMKLDHRVFFNKEQLLELR